MKPIRTLAFVVLLGVLVIPSAYATNDPARPDASDALKPATTPPKFTSGKDPGYTDEAREAKIEGTVILTVKINENGRVTDVMVRNSLDKGLDRNAVKAVKRWRFEPATANGRPVATETNVSVDFRIYD